MPNERPAEVFFNSACPICAAGVKEQRRVMEARAVEDLTWIDMSAAPEALRPEGLTLHHVRRHIYARDRAGSIGAPMPSHCSGRRRPAAGGWGG